MNNLEEKNLEQLVQEKQNTLKTDKLDMSFGELSRYYEENTLIIRPEYQRLFRWKSEQKSRFIESLLLGLPIPSIFVSENQEGKWELVDGLQRVSTAISFMGLIKKEESIESTEIDDEGVENAVRFSIMNGWKLEGCSVITELNGKTFEELPFKLQLLIKRYYCRVEILRSNSSLINIKYELFDRLNTGGSKATEQEIRNCIFRGEKNSEAFYNLIEGLSRESEFIELIKLPDRKKQELYDQELVLRFFSFLHFSQIGKKEINENLAPSMTKYMKEILTGERKREVILAKEKKEEIVKIEFNYEKQKDLFLRTIKIIKSINCFLNDNLLRPSNYNFSSTLYDIVMIGIALNIDYYEQNWEAKIESIKKIRQELLQIKLSVGGSGSSTAIKQRIEKATALFNPEI